MSGLSFEAGCSFQLGRTSMCRPCAPNLEHTFFFANDAPYGLEPQYAGEMR
jgi:hypothetical protein